MTDPKLSLGLASTNPAKERAVRSAFRRMRTPYRLRTLAVESGVSPQPLSEDETVRGARNRALALLERIPVDLAIAFEGGVDRNLWGTFTCEWCFVCDKDGVYGIGGGAQLLLPDSVAGPVLSGQPLSEVTDRLTGRTATGSTDGILGIMTKGLVTRSTSHADILILALARYLGASFYSNQDDAHTRAIASLLVDRVSRRRTPATASLLPRQLELQLH